MTVSQLLKGCQSKKELLDAIEFDNLEPVPTTQHLELYTAMLYTMIHNSAGKSSDNTLEPHQIFSSIPAPDKRKTKIIQARNFASFIRNSVAERKRGTQRGK